MLKMIAVQYKRAITLMTMLQFVCEHPLKEAVAYKLNNLLTVMVTLWNRNKSWIIHE